MIASIGGDDQLTVLKHLDPEVFRADPKPFFGYSDNTNLLNFLYSLGLPAFHGGSVMVQFGRGGAMHPDSERSLRAALFTPGEFELTPAAGWTDHDRDWAVPANLETEPPLFPGTGWTWHGSAPVSGKLWGGCLEILDWQLAANRWMLPIESYGGVLFLETSEELPDAKTVYRILRNFGERGLLERFDAVLWGRPKSWSLDHHVTPEESVALRRRAVRSRSIGRWRSTTRPHSLVTGLDIGHTDPQTILPYGGQVRSTRPRNGSPSPTKPRFRHRRLWDRVPRSRGCEIAYGGQATVGTRTAVRQLWSRGAVVRAAVGSRLRAA